MRSRSDLLPFAPAKRLGPDGEHSVTLENGPAATKTRFSGSRAAGFPLDLAGSTMRRFAARAF
jgi:hypothetical protein